MPLPTNLLLGPLLGYERGEFYTVCLLADFTLTARPVLHLSTGASIAFSAAGDTPSGRLWRAETVITRSTEAQSITCQLTAGGVALADPAGRHAWTFYVPGTEEQTGLRLLPRNDEEMLPSNTQAKPRVSWICESASQTPPPEFVA